MRIPLSHNRGKSLSRFFHEILTFHVPPGKKARILDPTCGKRYLWKYFLLRKFFTNKTLLNNYKEVVFSDIKDFGYNIVSDINDLHFDREFDGIVYDSPYFFGVKDSDDPRKNDYTGYGQDYARLLQFMRIGNEKFVKWLKPGRKVIVKCGDQYNTKLRKFFPLHITWVKEFSNFNLIDLFIFIHHRMSPTAFQVKNRPCSVVMHTYFLVFEGKNHGV